MLMTQTSDPSTDPAPAQGSSLRSDLRSVLTAEDAALLGAIPEDSDPTDDDDAPATTPPHADAVEPDAETGAPETPTDPESDGEPRGDTRPFGGLDIAKLAPEIQRAVKGMDKAIKRITAQKHEAREKLESIQAERDQLKSELDTARTAPRLAPTPDQPLADATTEQALDARVSHAKNVIAWCKANRHGATVPKSPGSSEEVEIDEDQVATMRETAEDLLTEHAPKQREWIKAAATAREAAARTYPKLGKEDASRAKALLDTLPALHTHPERDLIIGRLLMGEDIEKGRMVAFPKGAKKPASSSPSTAARSTQDPSPAPAATALTTLRERALASGDPALMADYLAAKRTA